MSISRKTYTTQDEIDFLDGIKDRVNKKGITITRLQKLLGYEKGMSLRVNWGDMHKAKIARHLSSIIKKESIKNAKKEMYIKKTIKKSNKKMPEGALI